MVPDAKNDADSCREKGLDATYVGEQIDNCVATALYHCQVNIYLDCDARD